MMALSMLLVLQYCALSQKIANRSDIICDGGQSNDRGLNCIDNTIVCPDDTDCVVHCGFNNRRRILSHHYTSCEHNIGCCDTNIICPHNATCTVDCTHPCQHATIYAHNASHLTINNCNIYFQGYITSTCYDMQIYCPQKDHTACEFNGNGQLTNTIIHTRHGFNQIITNSVLQFQTTIIYCVYNSQEYLCQSNSEGNACLPPSTECNKRTTAAPTTLRPSTIPTQPPTTTITTLHNETPTDQTTETTDTHPLNSQQHHTHDVELTNEVTWKYITYVIVLALFSIPALVIIIGIIYDTRFKGSDRPNYLWIIKSFAHVADLYTDIIFCVLLYIKASSLVYVAAIFVCCGHVLSNAVGLHHIHKWRKQKRQYVHDYDNLLIALSVLCGFYPCVALLSCRLFYLEALSMQLSNEERYKIQQMRFCSDILVENIPLMTIQIISVLYTKIDAITVLAFVFSSVSLMIGLLTWISRACSGDKCNDPFHSKTTVILRYRVYVKSCKIRWNHVYSHHLFAKTLAHSTAISIGKMETTEILPITNGIVCHMEIISDGSQEEHDCVDNMMKSLSVRNSSLFKCFRIALCQNLCIVHCRDLNVVTEVVRAGNRLTDSMMTIDAESHPFIALKSTSMPDVTDIDTDNEGDDMINLSYLPHSNTL
eukprot:217599_1